MSSPDPADDHPVPELFAFGSPVLPGLAKVGEEMNELGTVMWKLSMINGADMYWNGRVLHKELRDELADVISAAQYFLKINDFDQELVESRIKFKTSLYEQWTREQGARYRQQEEQKRIAAGE